jgi:hypothetical protein
MEGTVVIPDLPGRLPQSESGSEQKLARPHSEFTRATSCLTSIAEE